MEMIKQILFDVMIMRNWMSQFKCMCLQTKKFMVLYQNAHCCTLHYLMS